jgi:hypothetical protein
MRNISQVIHNLLNQQLILQTPINNANTIRNWGNNINNVYAHYDSYLLNVQQANSHGPKEKHPYIEQYEHDCDFARGYLILGTFPPSSYFNNLPLVNLPNPNVQNNLPLNYFYGNTNDFWDFLLGLTGNNVNLQNIRNHLAEKNISISDVFAFIQRKIMKDSKDTNLYNIVVNCKINEIFNETSNIHTILFTSGSLKGILGNQPSSLIGFRWILEDCCGGLSNFQISGSIDGNGPFYEINRTGVQKAAAQQDNGIIWWIRSESKRIRVINLPSPSQQASLKIPSTAFYLKWIKYMALTNGIPRPNKNQINNLNNYLQLHQNIFIKPFTKQYRRSVYQKVLDNTIQQIV